MIVFNPNKRISIKECLLHEYVTSIKDNSVIDPEYMGPPLKFEFEKEGVDLKTLINSLIGELSSFESGNISISI